MPHALHPFSVTVKAPGPYRSGFSWVIRKDKAAFRSSTTFHSDVRDALAEARSVMAPLIREWTEANGLGIGDVCDPQVHEER